MLTMRLWSLRLRWYAARVEWNDPLPTPDIQVFATFAPLSQDGVALPDSVGLSKGLVAIAQLTHRKAAGSNRSCWRTNCCTLGATDKYVPTTASPSCRTASGSRAVAAYPQQYGEIMAANCDGPATAMLPSACARCESGR
jgi:hypothetical protein